MTWYRAIDDGGWNWCIPASPASTARRRANDEAADCSWPQLTAGAGTMASHRSAALAVARSTTGRRSGRLILQSGLVTPRSMVQSCTGRGPARPRQRVIRPSAIPTCKIVRWVTTWDGAVDPVGVHPAVGYRRGAACTVAVDLEHVHQRAFAAEGGTDSQALPPLRSATGSPTVSLLDSELERRMARAGEALSLAGHARPPRRSVGYEVDFWVIDTPIILECDSW